MLTCFLVDITAYETKALATCGLNLADGLPHKIVFIGSGPLPLTAFLLAQTFPSINVTMIDRAGEAHDLASKWMHVVDTKVASRVDLLKMDFFDCNKEMFSSFDVVYLAVSDSL